MYHELEQHKTKDKVKWIFTMIAIILLAVFLTAACTQGFKNFNPWGWLNSDEEQTEEISDKVNGVLIPEVIENKGVSLMSAAIPAGEYAENGISPYAVSAVSIYVDNPSEFVTYNWAIEWKTAKSEAVASSVQLSANTGTSVSVSALKAFDTQVILTCSAHLGGSSKVSSSATCTIDYAQRFDGVSLNGTKITDGETVELSALVGADDDIVDALNNFVFNLTGNLGTGSLTGSAIPTVNGNVTVKSVMGMNNNDLSGKLPYSFSLADFIYEQMYLSPDYYLEGMLEGDSYALSLLYECIEGYDRDIEIKVNYTCGSDSGTLTFYVNISDSLFANYSAQNVALDKSGIVL